MGLIKHVSSTSVTLKLLSIFLLISLITQQVKADWDDDYKSKQKPIDPWLIVFLIIFFGLGIIGACIGCYCRFCGGADRYYGEPVRYVGRGVYIPERLVAHQGGPHTNMGSPYAETTQPYSPTTQPYGQTQYPPYGQTQYPPYGQTQYPPHGQGQGQGFGPGATQGGYDPTKA